MADAGGVCVRFGDHEQLGDDCFFAVVFGSPHLDSRAGVLQSAFPGADVSLGLLGIVAVPAAANGSKRGEYLEGAILERAGDEPEISAVRPQDIAVQQAADFARRQAFLGAGVVITAAGAGNERALAVVFWRSK